MRVALLLLGLCGLAVGQTPPTGWNTLSPLSTTIPKTDCSAAACSGGIGYNCVNVGEGSTEELVVTFNTSDMAGQQARFSWRDGPASFTTARRNFAVVVDGVQLIERQLTGCVAPSNEEVQFLITRNTTTIKFVGRNKEDLTSQTNVPLIIGTSGSLGVQLFVNPTPNQLTVEAPIASEDIPNSCSCDFCGCPAGCRLHACFNGQSSTSNLSVTFDTSGLVGQPANFLWTDGKGRVPSAFREYLVFVDGVKQMETAEYGCQVDNIKSLPIIVAGPTTKIEFAQVTGSPTSDWVFIGTGECDGVTAAVGVQLVSNDIVPNITTTGAGSSGISTNGTAGGTTTTSGTGGNTTTTTTTGTTGTTTGTTGNGTGSATGSGEAAEESSASGSDADLTPVYIGVGAGVGGCCLIIIIAAAVFFFVKKRGDKLSDMSEEMIPSIPSGMATPAVQGVYPIGASEPVVGGQDVYGPVPQSPGSEAHAYQQFNSGSESVAPKTNPGSLSGIFVIDYNEIELGQVLGKGGFGIVYLGNWAGQEVAVKMLKSDGDIQLTKDQIQEFQDEASLMMSIPGHINVCQFLGICTEPLVILTELCSNGSVHEYIKKNGDLDRQTVMHIVKGVASGMSHLHGQGIVHRDLAARNVLLNSSFDAKISDFGLSRVIDKTREGEDNDGVGQTKTEVGPLKWMAPECLRYLQYSQKTDVWAFSCTMYEIICGCEPYAGMGAVQVATGVSQGELQLELPADKLPHWPEIKELMALCMTFEPSTRPDFQTIVSYMANWAP